MKKFLFNTDFGSVLLVIVLSMITITLSTTLSIMIWGGGRFIYTTLIDNHVLNQDVLTSCNTVWTLLNIVGYILITLWMWVSLLTAVDTNFNTPKNEK